MVTRSILRPVLRPVTRAVSDTIRGFNPRSLFSAGEQGIWLDPSDFSTLYQDAAGTTPVTAVGQPVGLALDKSKGLALGPELVTNGDFAAGATGWTVLGSDATHIATFSGGTLRYQSDTTTPVLSIGQPNILPAGKTYLVTAVCSAWTSGSVKVAETSIGTLIVNGVGTFTGRIPTSSLSSFFIQRNTANVDLTLDSVSVREIAGNHAYQSTSASRPTLQQDSNGLYYLSFDGTDDGMATPSINFTATDKVTVWAGVRKLSDAARAIVVEIGNNQLQSFKIEAPNNAAQPEYLFTTAGSTVGFALYRNAAVAAPNTSVITGIGNISGDIASLRINGVQAAAFAGDQGTGNYGNYQLYIGRRGGATLPFNGRIYQLIVRGAESSAGQIAATEAYVNAKTRAYA